jgi:hypothetical protein
VQNYFVPFYFLLWVEVCEPCVRRTFFYGESTARFSKKIFQNAEENICSIAPGFQEPSHREAIFHVRHHDVELEAAGAHVDFGLPSTGTSNRADRSRDSFAR